MSCKNCDPHPCHCDGAEERPSIDELLNRPDVLEAFKVLIRNGLMLIPTQAEIFCAYCGETICYSAVPSRTGENADCAYSLKQIAKHRQGCAKFKASTVSESDLSPHSHDVGESLS